MESVPQNALLKFNADTLLFIRKQYGLDKLERMNESINILEEWLKKQNHIESINVLDRCYLERLIVNNKGSIEKCKKKIDKICTLRTLIPDFFEITDVDRNMLDFFALAVLPTMTPDYGRLLMVRVTGKQFETKMITTYFKYFVTICEYVQAYDYCNNVTILIDWNDVNIMTYLMALNIVEVRKSFDIAFEGFSLRVKGIHMITQSKAVEAAITIMKQLLSEKLGGRIHVHRTADTFYQQIPKEILPAEYGGKEVSIYQLRDKLAAEVSSNKFITFRREMNKARTNEAYRSSDTFNAEYMGMSGTFRTLSVD